MIGAKITHCEITKKLGEGGMGVVYMAEDTTLEHPVALNFLSAQLIEDEESRQRFIREAKASAARTHPNIRTVCEIGEVEGKKCSYAALGRTRTPRVKRHLAAEAEAQEVTRI